MPKFVFVAHPSRWVSPLRHDQYFGAATRSPRVNSSSVSARKPVKVPYLGELAKTLVSARCTEHKHHSARTLIEAADFLTLETSATHPASMPQHPRRRQRHH
jgi:hypothetical protein